MHALQSLQVLPLQIHGHLSCLALSPAADTQTPTDSSFQLPVSQMHASPWPQSLLQLMALRCQSTLNRQALSQEKLEMEFSNKAGQAAVITYKAWLQKRNDQQPCSWLLLSSHPHLLTFVPPQITLILLSPILVLPLNIL